MPRKIKVKRSWTRIAPLKQAGFARGTAKAMTANTSFQTPKVVLTDMEKAATRLETAWGLRANGQVAKDEYDNSIVDLLLKLEAQAVYVEEIADGNAQIIHSAGFESTKATGTSQNPPDETEAARLDSQSGGTVKASVNKIDEAKHYTFIGVIDGDFNVTIDANGQIEIPATTHAIVIVSTKISVKFTGLPPLKSFKVGVVANNNVGASGLSPIVETSTIK